MGGFVKQHKQNDNVLSPSVRVSTERLIEMFQDGSIDWPTLKIEETDDRSKANWLVKSLALVQIVWFIVQLIGRWAQGLAVTTLELFTLGVVFCSMLISAASWEKPFEIQMPVLLHATNNPAKRDHIDHIGLFTNLEENGSGVTLCAICLILGAVHIVAWNFHFPSFPEQILLKICSIGITVLPISSVIVIICSNISHIRGALEDPMLYGILCIYTLFRLYMFVEMFAGLRSVPASVYQTPQWSQYFPSFG
jgi:hypothetical protein